MPISKADQMRRIRGAIETVLKANPNIRLIELQQGVCKIVPIAQYEQIERQLRLMSDAEVAVDRRPRRNYLYSWAGGASKIRIRSPQPSRAIDPDTPDIEVKQIIVPCVSRLLSGPVKSPMEWTLDYLAQAPGESCQL